jgi:hypothetical protein
MTDNEQRKKYKDRILQNVVPGIEDFRQLIVNCFELLPTDELQKLAEQYDPEYRPDSNTIYQSLRDAIDDFSGTHNCISDTAHSLLTLAAQDIADHPGNR